MAESPTPWDAVLKEVVTLLFGQAGAAVTTEVEVGRLPRKIDSVAVCDDAALAWLKAGAVRRGWTLLERRRMATRASPAGFRRRCRRARARRRARHRPPRWSQP